MVDPTLDPGLHHPQVSGNGGFLTLRGKRLRNAGRKNPVRAVWRGGPQGADCETGLFDLLCVLGMLSNLSVPHFPPLQNGDHTI